MRGRTRIDDWLFSKIPQILSAVYLLLLSQSATPSLTLFCLGLLLTVSSLGYASLGYLINDFFDRDEDQVIGKKNVFIDTDGFTLTCLVVITFLICITPVFWLPRNLSVYGLLALEIVLFTLYSVRPFRFKERGWLGIITDSLYASVVPCMILMLTTAEYLALSASFSFWVSVMFFYLFASGIRKILAHQMDDYHNDVASQINTLTAAIGLEKVTVIQSRWLMPLEGIILLLFSLSLLQVSSILSLLVVVTLTAQMFFSPFGEGFVKCRSYMNVIWNRKLNVFSEGYFPALVLVCLALEDVRYVMLLLLHFSLFLPAVSGVADYGKDYIGKTIYYKVIPSAYFQLMHIGYHNGVLRLYFNFFRPLYFTIVQKPVIWVFHNVLMRIFSWFWHFGFFVLHGRLYHSKKRTTEN